MAQIYNRSGNRSGCPECRAATSRIEVFLLCELRYIYGEILCRKQIQGFEIDIQIPELQIGIEVDGDYWHRSKLEKDERKSQAVTACGLQLVRVRDQALPPVADTSEEYSPKEPLINVVCRLVELLHSMHPKACSEEYLQNRQAKNEAEYRSILSQLPAPTSGDSLADLYPDVAREWDYKKMRH
jgi:very-short-patch-repair endonuclease